MSANYLPPATVAAIELPRPRAGVMNGRSARRKLTASAVLTILVLSVPFAALAAPPPPFYQDFRGGRRLVAPLDFAGADASTFIKPEDGGLRITLPAGRKKFGAIGIALTEPVTGNFEITTAYELLPMDLPQRGYGAGLEVYLMTATPTQEAVGFYRLVSPEKGDAYMCSRMTTIDGKRQYKHQLYDAPAKAGRLRLTRAGGEVTFWAAEGAADDFRELCRYDLGPEDLKIVRLGANSGTAPEPVDLRIVDVKIRSDEPIVGPVPAFDPNAPSKGWRRGWLVAAGLVGLLVALSLLGTWFYVRRSRPAAAVTPSPPAPDKRAGPEASVPPISLLCSGCGKKLKARPEFAGKRVKCPHCQDAVVVPRAGAGDSGRISS
jgi:hypothetical protein